jgi:hypothetical protein
MKLTETIDYCTRLLLDQINQGNYRNSGLTEEEYVKKMTEHLYNLKFFKCEAELGLHKNEDEE